jgi:pentatricopeptide repeat protein
MFCKCGSLVEVRKVFDAMQLWNMISWTMMLAIYAKQGLNREAYLLYEQLLDKGLSVTCLCIEALSVLVPDLETLKKPRLFIVT